LNLTLHKELDEVLFIKKMGNKGKQFTNNKDFKEKHIEVRYRYMKLLFDVIVPTIFQQESLYCCKQECTNGFNTIYVHQIKGETKVN
jgi:hypothetical protein